MLQTALIIYVIIHLWVLSKSIHNQNHKLTRIMSTQQDLTQQLTDLSAQVDTISAGVSSLEQHVDDLEAALQNQTDVTPELQAAVDALKSKVTSIVGSLPTTDTTTETTTEAPQA
jgi:peptidoglycan hydrolase CwlO-like protein